MKHACFTSESVGAKSQDPPVLLGPQPNLLLQVAQFWPLMKFALNSFGVGLTYNQLAAENGIIARAARSTRARAIYLCSYLLFVFHLELK
jgi:hypothetical protein